MEMSNFRVESHVAQKSRRDKLRIQQNSDQNQQLEDYANNMEQLSVHHQALGPSSKYGSLSYDPNVFSSEMLSYVTRTSQLLVPQNDALVSTHQESASIQFGRPNCSVTLANSSHQVPSKVSGVDPHNPTTWKSVGLQQSGEDWLANYPNGCPMGIDQSSSNNFPLPSFYAKPTSFGYHQDLDSFNVPQKHYRETHYGSSPICQNNLQEVVSAAMEAQRVEMASLAQPHMKETGINNSNELLLLPAYGDQSKTLHVSDDPRWVSTAVGGCNQWNGNSSYVANKSIRNPTTVGNDSSTQGLSLSLSSVPQTKDRVGPFRGRGDSQDLINDLSGSKALKSDQLCSVDPKGFTGSKIVESTRHNTVGTSGLARGTGPLGPFTGYATILKSSKYLKPTHELLSESCHISSQEHVQTCEAYSRKDSEDMVRGKGCDSGASSSAFYASNDNISGEAGGGGGGGGGGGDRSSSSESYRPEFQQKKAKLLYMQEEICRRYKQYHQQMQMVVSSFESVPGLTSATPYISLALKAVTRHFRSLKNAITLQLRHTRKALGEDFSSPTTGTSSSKGDTSSRTRFFDHGFQKHQKSSGGGFFEPQQPVWRPQRGLPERAVSVLRTWLFDHFLHPYPTDTDKHMLANQTGLTRNQVSNWFINARVRVWKPMVEEIHTLETKAMEEPNSNAGNHLDNNDEIPTGRLLSTNTTSNVQGECSRNNDNNTVTLARMGPDEASPAFWNQEKRSRIECQNIPTSMDGSLFGFEPYQQRGIEIGGLGAVSLTLGLRQSAENAQQKQQLQNQEHQLRQQFGGHLYKYS